MKTAILLLYNTIMFIHKLKTEVGEKEKHTFEVVYSKWMGRVEMKVDGGIVRTDRILSFLDGSPTHRVEVGDKEKHIVNVEIRPGAFFFIKPTIILSVDDKVVEKY